MPRTTTSLGGGIADATGTYGTISTATDYNSAWTPSTAVALAHGGFDATGVTMNTTVKPVNVVTFGLRTGGTSAGGNSAASYYNQLSTATDGTGGYNNNVAVTGYTGSHSTNSTASAKYTNNWNLLSEYDRGDLKWLVYAGTTYYYGIHGASSGNFVFARGGTGTIWVNGTASTAWAGDSLSGEIIWDTVPSAPTITSASINTSGQLSLGWNVGTDDGQTATAAWDDTSGDHVRGYNIVYKATTDSAWKVFTANLTSWTNTGGSARTITGLTPANGYFIPGKTYEFRIAGLNGTTDAVQTDYSAITAVTGVRSDSANALAPGGVYNGSTYAPMVAKVYNGSSWVTPTTFKVYKDGAWYSLI